MLSLVLSTFAFFIATFFIRRSLDESGIPRTMTRALVVFTIALGIAYGVAAFVDWLT